MHNIEGESPTDLSRRQRPRPVSINGKSARQGANLQPTAFKIVGLDYSVMGKRIRHRIDFYAGTGRAP